MTQEHSANDAWEALLTAHSRLIRRFEAEDVWGEVGMRGYDVLYTLSKRPGPVRMGELGSSVLLSQPGLSRLVERLVQRGLVERSTDPSDRRIVLVGLTPDGADRQRAIGRQHARSVTRAMAVLSPEELGQLAALTRKLSSANEPRRAL